MLPQSIHSKYAASLFSHYSDVFWWSLIVLSSKAIPCLSEEFWIRLINFWLDSIMDEILLNAVWCSAVVVTPLFTAGGGEAYRISYNESMVNGYFSLLNMHSLSIYLGVFSPFITMFKRWVIFIFFLFSNLKMNLIAYNTRHNSCILFGFYVRQNCKSNHKIENTEKWIMVKITRY